MQLCQRRPVKENMPSILVSALMKRSVRNTVALLISLLLLQVTALGDNGRILRHSNPVPGRYMVILKDARGNHPNVPGIAHEMAARYGARIPRNRQGEELFQSTVKGFVTEVPEAAALAMSLDPRVDFVEEDAHVYASSSPRSLGNLTWSSSTANFPSWDLWGLDRIDETSRVWNGSTWQGDKSYTYATDGSGVYIYVIDTGVYRGHDEFSNGNVLDGVEFGDDTNSSNQPYAPCGTTTIDEASSSPIPHGTGVASVAAGKTVGVASGAYIVPIKMFRCDGTAYLSWFCLGMDWVVGPSNTYRYSGSTPTPGIVTTSIWFESATQWGTSETDTTGGALGQATQDVIRGCPLADAPCPSQRGFAVIASANNQHGDGKACDQWPAKLSYNAPYTMVNSQKVYDVGYSDLRVITVGGTDEQDRVWDCSNFTSECWNANFQGSNYGQCVDIYAPAHNVRTAAMRNTTGFRVYPYNTGTSFAAPYVAAIGARLLQANNSLTPADVKAGIFNEAQTVNGVLVAHIDPSH
jgi:serine protease